MTMDNEVHEPLDVPLDIRQNGLHDIRPDVRPDPVPVDQRVLERPAEPQRVMVRPAEPLMRDGGKLWCNVDAKNVVEGRRQRR